MQSNSSLAAYASQQGMTSTDVKAYSKISNRERFSLEFMRIHNGWVVSLGEVSIYFDTLENALKALPTTLVESKLREE